MKEEVILVKCENGHRFPVNTSKHKDRNYRLCPKCRAKVEAKGFFNPEFQPDKNWQLKRINDRLEAEQKRRQKPRLPFSL